MMYVLGIILFALAMHVVYKYQAAVGGGVDPLDEANLIKSISESTQRKYDPGAAGGDGQTGFKDDDVSVQPQPQPQPKAPAQTSLLPDIELSDDGESWVADIQFTDSVCEDDRNEPMQEEKERDE